MLRPFPLPSGLRGALLFAALWSGGMAHTFAAAAPAPDESYGVEVRIIEASRRAPADGGGPALDPALAGLAKELQGLPFKSFVLMDSLQKDLRKSESVSMQFGRPDRKRFLRVLAEGKDAGKIKLAVSMEVAKKKKPRQEFKSGVSIPEGGQLVVVANRANPGPLDSVILLAISARTLPPGTTTPATSSAPAPAPAPPAPAR